MEKSDNNGTLVCGTEMLQQRQMGEGMLVCICPADFSASSPVFVRKLEIKIDTGTDMGVFFLCKKHGIGKSKHCFFCVFTYAKCVRKKTYSLVYIRKVCPFSLQGHKIHCNFIACTLSTSWEININTRYISKHGQWGSNKSCQQQKLFKENNVMSCFEIDCLQTQLNWIELVRSLVSPTSSTCQQT